MNQLKNKSKEFVRIRCGVSFGKLVIGFIGNSLRFFGETIHMANRLENRSDDEYCLCDSAFGTKLIDELDVVAPACKQVITNQLEEYSTVLKGFTDRTSCYKYRYLNTLEDIFSTAQNDDSPDEQVTVSGSSSPSSPISLVCSRMSSTSIMSSPLSRFTNTPSPSARDIYSSCKGIQSNRNVELMTKYPPMHVSDVLKVRDKMIVLSSCQSPHYIEYANNGWCDYCEWDLHEVLGHTFSILQGTLHYLSLNVLVLYSYKLLQVN